LNPELDPLFRSIPSDTVYVTVDKESVRKSGMLIPDSIPDRMMIDLSGTNSIYKNRMMMLEMISHGDFSRPLYMATTVGDSNYGKLFKNFIQEGLAYRISPFYFDGNSQVSTVLDADKMYDNMVNKYHYGNLKQPGLYIDETTMRMCWTHRRWFSLLINNLVARKDFDRAKKALAKCAEEIPDYNVPHVLSGGSLDLAKAYMACGETEKGKEIFDKLQTVATQYLKYYYSLPYYMFAGEANNAMNNLYLLDEMQKTYAKMANDRADETGKPYTQSQIDSFTKKAAELESLLNANFQRYNDLAR